MLNLLLTFSISILPVTGGATTYSQEDAQEEKGPKAPDPEVVEKALADLEHAFKKGKSAERKEAIKAHADVNDPAVIKWIEKGLKDKDPLVQAEAVEAFRWLPNPAALKALHTSLAKDKSIKKVEALHEAVVKAIGQHCSPTSVDVLMDNALADAPKSVTIARIYSLGKIRDTKSLEALMDLMQKTGKASKRGGARQPLMKQIAVSLEVLTGKGFKEDENAWVKWWRDNKRTYKVSEKPGILAPKVLHQWETYWKAYAPAKKDADEAKKKRKKKQTDTDGE